MHMDDFDELKKLMVVCMIICFFVLLGSIVYKLKSSDAFIENINHDRIYTVVLPKDFPPFSYPDENGDQIGFSYEMANDMCHALAIKCNVVPSNINEIFQKTKNNEVDILIIGQSISSKLADQLFFQRIFFIRKKLLSPM